MNCRPLSFPSLQNDVLVQPSEEQLRSMDVLIDNMDLSRFAFRHMLFFTDSHTMVEKSYTIRHSENEQGCLGGTRHWANIQIFLMNLLVIAICRDKVIFPRTPSLYFLTLDRSIITSVLFIKLNSCLKASELF